MRYTDKIMSIVKSALDKYEGIDAQVAELKGKLDREQITGKYFSEQKAELERQRGAIRTEASTAIEAARTAYCEAAMKGTEIDGSMLHDDAKLLQLDLAMTERQFTALVEKHKDNPLMAQLLRAYSDKHPGTYADYIPTADVKMSEFNGYADAANAVLRNPSSIQMGLFMDGKYTPAVCTEAE